MKRVVQIKHSLPGSLHCNCYIFVDKALYTRMMSRTINLPVKIRNIERTEEKEESSWRGTAGEEISTNLEMTGFGTNEWLHLS